MSGGHSRVREKDLAHGSDDDRFGRAVTKCEGYTPDCIYYGRCMYGGQCFASPGHLVAARMIEKLIPPDGPAGTHFAYLRRVAEMLRDGRVEL